jgi:hypothetical protein
VVALLAVFGLLGARPAIAEDPRIEAAAKDALKRARVDYAAKAYDRAIGRLRRADHACVADRCTPSTRAALLRDMGTVLFRMGELDAPEKLFKEALALEPTIELNPAYDAPDLRGAWAEAREQAGVPTQQQQPAGDFVHTPAREQQVNTPLPVYVEFAGGPPATVVVKYMGATMNAFKRLKLNRLGNGWGGLIPCADVTPGVMRYFVQGFDASGDPILNSGDPKHPYTVLIRESLTGPGPSLPGESPPAQCAEVVCGPDEPNCGAAGEKPKLSNGEACEKDDECVSSTCEHGSCAAEAKESGEGRYARIWVGVSASFDFVSLPDSNDACKLDGKAAPTNSQGYYCTNPDGTDFPTRASPAENNTLTTGNAGQVSGGPTAGNIRVMASVDYALSTNFLLGGRIGFVLDEYPGQAASHDSKVLSVPLHLEARATYLFGDNPLGTLGFAPMVYAAAGIAEFDADTTVVVAQTKIAGQSPKQAWLFSGPGFVALGGGVRYAFSQRIGFLAAIKATGAFGSSGFLPIIGPEFGLQFGF